MIPAETTTTPEDDELDELLLLEEEEELLPDDELELDELLLLLEEEEELLLDDELELDTLELDEVVELVAPPVLPEVASLRSSLVLPHPSAARTHAAGMPKSRRDERIRTGLS